MKVSIKTIAIAIMLIAAMCVNSCEKEKGEGLTGNATLAKNFIWKYVDPTVYYTLPRYRIETDEADHYGHEYHTGLILDSDKIGIWTVNVPNFFVKDENGVSLYTYDEVEEWENENVISRTSKSNGSVIYDKPYNPNMNILFDSLSRAHNDTNYNQSIIFTTSYVMLYRKIESIDIVSDTDYDLSHPAGTKLNNIFKVRFFSALEYIESNRRDISGGVFDKTMPLTQFNSEKRKLTADMKCFTLTSAPAATSTHRFTITYTDEDGKVLTTTTAPITIQGAN